MTTPTLSVKDHMEANYWVGVSPEISLYHRRKMALYLWAFGYYNMPASVLEIGCGPYSGVLPYVSTARHRVAVDPNINLYRARGIMEEISGIEYHALSFEQFQCDSKFNAVFSIDSLDHGEMGFHLLPKIDSLLDSGGRFYLHVNLRPAARLNNIHDHSLTLADLDAQLPTLNWIELRRDLYSDDVDGKFQCLTLVGVWEKKQ